MNINIAIFFLIFATMQIRSHMRVKNKTLSDGLNSSWGVSESAVALSM